MNLNMKRLLSILIALTVGMTVEAQTVITSVGTVAEFQSFANSVNKGDNYNGITVTLTAKINLDGVNWTPIGTSAHPFNGTFDGQGHTISNLTVTATDLYAGLFGRVGSTGIVKNVNISSGTIAVSTDPGELASYHGAIVGLNEGTVIGCFNSALVNGYSYIHARIGGIVGENQGSIQNCYNTGEVYSGQSEVFIGGITGNNNRGSVQNCFMSSEVNKNGIKYHYPVYGNNNSGTVTGCFYSTGYTTDVPLPIALVDNADNSSTLSGGNLGSGKNVLLSGRTLYTDTGWNTLCLPFDIPAGATGYSPIAGAKVMTLSSSSYSTSKGYGELTLNFVDATSIEAGKPYIVKWNTDLGNISNPVFMNVEVSNTTQTTETTCVDFVGSFSPVAIAAEDKTMLYLGADNKLFYPSSAMTINSCRAYFRLKGDLVAGEPINTTAIKSFNLNFGDEETTGIINLETNHSPLGKTEGASWYDLSGRKLQELKNLHPGLYIYNGRKVLIK